MADCGPWFRFYFSAYHDENENIKLNKKQKYPKLL